MPDRRKKVRSASDRRKGEQFGRTPGSFGDTVNATFRVLRKAERETPKPFKLEARIYKLRGSLEISNLDSNLVWAGYEMDDEVRVTVEFVKKQK
jgi:hypothetical protein